MSQELEKKSLEIVTQANNLVIVDDENYQLASAILTKAIKPVMAEIKSTFRPIIEKAHASHKEAVAQEKKHLDPLIRAEAIIKQKIGVYVTDCERKRREEQAKLEAEARKKQEELALAEAAAAETKEEAEEIIQKAIEEKPIVIAPKTEPKAQGISSRVVFKWRLENIDSVNRQFLTLNETQVNTVVRTLGKNAEKLIGGISVYEERVVSARA